MPEDTVRLGIRVGSKSVVTADDRLDKLGRTAATTERKTERLGKTTTRVTKRMSTGFSAVARAAGVMAAAVLSVQSALGAIGQARQLNAALGEVSTLIEGTTAQMGLLERESKRLAATFGTSATSQVKAFYQAISAGADGVAGASSVLEAANKLAIGGLTSVTTGVDVLTTAMNVYAAEGITATGVSDALFVAMRAGKTTIGELSASVGKVIPLAQKMGVSFDEVTATVAALTKGGISTSESVTGLRAILASVAKPTSEASKLAKKLGLEFDSTAVASKGLAGFIADIEKATKGNTDQMALLFGGVEALIPALALTGTAGEYLAEIMEKMADKAGATETAFEKMQKTLDRKLTTAMKKFQLASEDMGQKLLQIVVPVVEVFADNIDRLTTYLVTGGAILTGYGVYAAGAAIAVAGLSTTLGFLRVALLRTGLLAIVVLFGELIYQMDKAKKEAKGLAINNDTLLKTTDGVTIAIGKEIIQSQLLKQALGEERIYSVDVANQKLSEAKARLINVKSIIAENSVFGTEEHLLINRKIAEAQSAVDLARSRLPFRLEDPTPLERLGGPRLVPEESALERNEKVLVKFFKIRDQLLKQDVELIRHRDTITDNIEKLTEAIANQVDGWVFLNGAITPISVATSDLSDEIDNLNDTLKTSAEIFADLISQINGESKAIEDQIATFGLASGAVERYNAHQQIMADLKKANITLHGVENLVLDAALDKLEQNVTALENLEKKAQLFASTRTPLELFNKKMEELNDLLDQGVIKWPLYSRAVQQAQDRLSEAATGTGSVIKSKLKEYADAALDTGSQIDSALVGAFQGAEDALVSFVTTGKLQFADLARSISADLARIAIRQSITGPIAKLLGSSFSLPGFAHGGYHRGGLRIVGERGPELEATGPSRIYNTPQTQRILSGGNSRPVINVTTTVVIQAPATGASGATPAGGDVDPETARKVGQQMERVIKEAVNEQLFESADSGGPMIGKAY